MCICGGCRHQLGHTWTLGREEEASGICLAWNKKPSSNNRSACSFTDKTGEAVSNLWKSIRKKTKHRCQNVFLASEQAYLLILLSTSFLKYLGVYNSEMDLKNQYLKILAKGEYRVFKI